MANNHQGDVEHALKIVKSMGDIARRYGLKAGIKLQFRHLDTFIHPNLKESGANKHIKRFESTRLSREQFQVIYDAIKEEGMLTICTPFDEKSVDIIEEMKFDIIKIGSPSLYDFCLFDRISRANLPIIISSGGCSIEHVDKIVSFFDHRMNTFALMHCVSIYPTPNNELQLNTVKLFQTRFPHLTIGFSTHESPDNLDAIKIAYTLGARMFEKHVGFPTDQYKLNLYSSNPEQTEEWVKSYITARDICGSDTYRQPTDKEMNDLKLLNRGVFVKRNIKKGESISNYDIYFAFPISENGILTSEFTDGLVADRDYNINDGIKREILDSNSIVESNKRKLYHYIHKIKAFLRTNKVSIGYDSYMEASHHFGIDNFEKIGCFIIECFNTKEYAKKIIVQLPGQINPHHYHKNKDETFHLLHGDLSILINGKEDKIMRPGDFLRVPRYTLHQFTTKNGAIFEEISTSIVNNDSFYIDINIQNQKRENRKTKLYNWIIV